jgi:hypothetical protein
VPLGQLHKPSHQLLVSTQRAIVLTRALQVNIHLLNISSLRGKVLRKRASVHEPVTSNHTHSNALGQGVQQRRLHTK